MMNNFSTTKKVLLFGHRGACGEAPENTLSAFQLALSAGMDGIEFDLRLCRSGEVVVVHDATIARITGTRAPVSAYTYEELKKLDVGRWFSERFQGERVPLFEEVIELFADKLIFDLELKGKSIHTDGLEEKVVQIIKKRGLEERVIISSFNPMILLRILMLDPSLKIGLNFLDDSWHWLRKIWFAHFSHPFSVHPTANLVDQFIIEFARKRNALIIPWKANKESEIKRLLEIGVDGIISDYPFRLKSVYNNWKESTSTEEGSLDRARKEHSSKIF